MVNKDGKPCGPAPEDLSGKIFNFLTAIRIGTRIGTKNKWICICKCGRECMIRSSHLKSGQIKSCGCIGLGEKRYGKFVHGKHLHPLYATWKHMINRCYNKEHPAYGNYGKRNISVCDSWLNSIDTFIEDMGQKPSKLHSLDRIDNNGNYCKENCRWATDVEQNNNRRNVVYIEYQNSKHTIIEWSKITGLNPGTIASRYYKGWSAEEIFQPLLRKKDTKCAH